MIIEYVEGHYTVLENCDDIFFREIELSTENTEFRIQFWIGGEVADSERIPLQYRKKIKKEFENAIINKFVFYSFANVKTRIEEKE